MALKPDSSGKASAALSAEAVEQAAEQAEAGSVTVTVELDGEAGSVDVSLPAEPLKRALEAGKVETVIIDTGLAKVILSREQLIALTGSGTGQIQLTVAHVDPSSLPSGVIERIGGDYPVFDFRLNNDSGAVTNFTSDRAVTVHIDYTLKPGENPSTLVIYYVDDEGQLVVQKNVRYDAAAEQLVFSPKHFSTYAAANVPVTFSDIRQPSWATSSIEALAAREIVQGVGGQRFNPNDRITRAQFVQMLVGTLDVPAAAGEASFTDVEPGAWYDEAVRTAAQLGIVHGRTDGSFGVNEPITRQDIAVMTFRAASAAGALTGVSGAPDFSDKERIADYALEAIASMQAAGLINGHADGSFAPLANASRAEAAVILYNLLLAL